MALHSPGQMQSLNVIALISGGKDSFYALLHVLQQGHKVVALANLHPPTLKPPSSLCVASDNESHDLHSMMYQTAGHELVALYAQATGIPLYRAEIAAVTGGNAPVGATAEDEELKKAEDEEQEEKETGKEEEEIQALNSLLVRVIRDVHPKPTAVCCGALLSTYQRVRIEAVAVNLGLVSLAPLWNYLALPPLSVLQQPYPQHIAAAAGLLQDMAASGLRAHIVKVASGGLDAEDLWLEVTAPQGIAHLATRLARFGKGADAAAAVVGEGGEFETLVVDGPQSVFEGRLDVDEAGRHVLHEGGGCALLAFKEGCGRVVVEKDVAQKVAAGAANNHDYKKLVRVPDLLDPRFADLQAGLLDCCDSLEDVGLDTKEETTIQLDTTSIAVLPLGCLQNWTVAGANKLGSVEQTTQAILDDLRLRLEKAVIPLTAVITSTVILRRSSDYPAFNKIYRQVFTHPLPPSQLCIFSGATMPQNVDIVLHLTVCMENVNEKRGLHIQSRSYWAPASTGRYSQAIEVPLIKPTVADEEGQGEALRAICITGQIPVVPATMIMAPRTQDGTKEFVQALVLSLQHLWRIAIEMRVQWFAGAIVFLAIVKPFEGLQSCTFLRAQLAQKAWSDAHLWRTDTNAEDSEDQEPDLWERNFNYAAMRFGASMDTGDVSATSVVPAWEIFRPGRGQDGIKFRQGLVSSTVLAEVDSLPEGAPMQWYAPVGLRALRSGSANHVTAVSQVDGRLVATAEHLRVVCGSRTIQHSTIWIKDISKHGEVDGVVPLIKQYWLTFFHAASISENESISPYLILVNQKAGTRRCDSNDKMLAALPVVFCHNLYVGGKQVMAVAYFRTLLQN